MTAPWRSVRRASPRLRGESLARMSDLDWFAALPADTRAQVGLVLHAGVGAFAGWLREGQPPTADLPEVFAAAPRALTREITLQQTVQLVRIAVDVVERAVDDLVPAQQAPELGAAVARYSREVAFAAADVYAAAAEARGAWDARLEAGVVEALARGRPDEVVLARAAELGWRRGCAAVPVACRLPEGPDRTDARRLRDAAGAVPVLAGEARGGLLVVLGVEPDDADAAGRAVASVVPLLPDGPVVVGPVAGDLAGAAGPADEALAGLRAVPAWPAAPRPVTADDLLAERAVLGDAGARRRLLAEVHDPLAGAGGDLLVTAAAYLDVGSSVEAAARALVVHANTVRYRLRKTADLVGLDLTDPRHAQVVRLALVLGRVQDP